MIAILYLVSLGVFFIFLVIATIAVIASSIKRKKKAKKLKKQGKYDEYDEEQDEEEMFEEEKPTVNVQAQPTQKTTEDDIFAEAVLEATQIAEETAAQVAQPVQQSVAPTQPVAQTQPVQQSAVSTQPVAQTQPVQQSATPTQPIAPTQPVMPEQSEAPMQQVVPEQPVAPMQQAMPEQPVAPMQQAVPEQAMAPVGEDSAFADSAFADSAFTDSAFANPTYVNNADGNAFPGSAFENPTLVDPSAMNTPAVTYTHGGDGHAPVGNFYWFNKEDVADRPDYKPEEMYYRHFTTAHECIEDLLIEMYDCALVRTEDIRYIAYGIEPRYVAMRDVAATGNAAYNAAKKRKEPTKEDLDKIYRKWCSYVDKFFEIVEFRADNTTIGIIRDKL